MVWNFLAPAAGSQGGAAQQQKRQRGGLLHLPGVFVEVVDGGLPVRAKIGDAAALQDERAVEEREGVRRRAVDGCADGDAARQ